MLIKRTNIPIKIRNKVKNEASNRCSISDCEYQGTCEIHHIFYWSKVYIHREINLILLCPNHHKQAHDNILTKAQLLYFRRRQVNKNIVKDNYTPSFSCKLENNYLFKKKDYIEYSYTEKGLSNVIVGEDGNRDALSCYTLFYDNKNYAMRLHQTPNSLNFITNTTNFIKQFDMHKVGLLLGETIVIQHPGHIKFIENKIVNFDGDKHIKTTLSVSSGLIKAMYAYRNFPNVCIIPQEKEVIFAQTHGNSYDVLSRNKDTDGAEQRGGISIRLTDKVIDNLSTKMKFPIFKNITIQVLSEIYKDIPKEIVYNIRDAIYEAYTVIDEHQLLTKLAKNSEIDIIVNDIVEPELIRLNKEHSKILSSHLSLRKKGIFKDDVVILQELLNSNLSKKEISLYYDKTNNLTVDDIYKKRVEKSDYYALWKIIT